MLWLVATDSAIIRTVTLERCVHLKQMGHRKRNQWLFVATLGTVIFTLIGVATTAVLVHGIFRDTPVDMDRIDDLGVERADGMGMEDDKVEMDDDAARPRHPETA